jgi:hypothetical protein
LLKNRYLSACYCSARNLSDCNTAKESVILSGCREGLCCGRIEMMSVPGIGSMPNPEMSPPAIAAQQRERVAATRIG